MTTPTRNFEINGVAYRAKKSLFGGPRQYNGKGEWITAWYVSPVDAGFTNDGEFVGLYLSDLNRWIKRNTK